MKDLLHELRFAVRTAAKNPGFTCVAVVVLAIGIGANTAIFGLANAAFFRPLPFPHSERLAFVWQNNSRTGETEGLVSYPNYSDWRARNHCFEDMAFFMTAKPLLIGDAEPERILGATVGVNFFSVLGVEPVFGRGFAADEQLLGHENVVVIGNGLWRSRFAADPKVIGRYLSFGNSRATIIGVMPEGFSFPEGAELWLPRVVNEFLRAKSRQYPNFEVIARLRAGASWMGARAELDSIATRLGEEFPDIDSGVGVRIVPFGEHRSRNVRQGILVLWGAILGVLLIACLNASNLIMARAAGRSKEIAIRCSLGASWWRIARQSLAESFVLAGAGAAVGFILARWIVTLVSRLDPDIAMLDGSLIDFRVLGYTLGATAFAAFVCGVLPFCRPSQLDLSRSLNESNPGTAHGARLLRKILMVAQISLTFVLLVGSGLLVRSLWHVFAQDPGFDANHVLTLRLFWPGLTMSPVEAKRNVVSYDLLTRVRALPGVVAAASASYVLFPDEMYKVPFVIEGRPSRTSGQRPFLPHGEATPEYFRAMGIPVLRGRVFSQPDTAQAAPSVAVINESMARRYWADDDPIGKRFRFDDPNFKSPWFTIVGIVGDVRQEGLEKSAGLMAYLPSAGYWADDIVIRTSTDPRTVIPSVRAQVRAVDKNLVVDNVRLVSELFSLNESKRRFNALLLGGFACTALLLALVGIYGSMSYSVTQRSREIGVRVALGARERDVFGLVVRHGLAFTFVGLAFGIAGALAVTRVISSLLYGISATDPATFAAIAILMVAASLLACYIPARRASKIDPLEVLRHE